MWTGSPPAATIRRCSDGCRCRSHTCGKSPSRGAWRKRSAAGPTGEGLHLAIADQDDLFLGSVSLKKTHWRHGHTEVGYWVMPDARRRGIATAAAGALSQWALRHERVFRVELTTTAPGNLASQRVAAKAGFTFEGVARSAGIVHTGRTDLRIYSLIREDLDAERG